MRLLDRVARCGTPLLVSLEISPTTRFEVTGAHDFAARIAQCPLRFVLADDLARVSAELAFADGERLVGCLDLLRVPALQMWIEWNDEVHKRVIFETGSASDYDAAASGRRVGVLVEGTPDGYGAVLRTFWADGTVDDDSAVALSPLETHIDLRGNFAEASDVQGILTGGFAAVTDEADPAMASLLDHVRFRFDARWAAYYRAAAAGARSQREVVRASLAAVARDVPLLLAFFLLLSAKDATRSMPVSRAVINRKRQAHGRIPLLDHIEVRASLDAVAEADAAADADFSGRQSPRLHHVRGHLVRRDNRVFWRVPHLRGSASRGMVHSRTVCLAFARPRACNAATSAVSS
jgi:hypothetical protein